MLDEASISRPVGDPMVASREPAPSSVWRVLPARTDEVAAAADEGDGTGWWDVDDGPPTWGAARLGIP